MSDDRQRSTVLLVNFYEHHLGDYLRDTAHLSMLEDAAYRRLLDAYYIREKPLPADPKECCKLARASARPEKTAVNYVLEQFFVLLEDGYHQARADQEIARFQGKRIKAKASADARWSQSDGNANASADAMRTHMRSQSEGNALQSPVPSPQSPDRNLLPSSPPDLRITPSLGSIGDHTRASEGFAAIKAAYPKFTGRQDWINAQHGCNNRIERDGCTWESLLEVTQRYARYCSNGGISGPQYVLTPGKFFTEPDKPWAQAWDPPPTKAETRLGTNLNAAEEFMRRTEGAT